MTTSESRGRFFYKTNRFESIRITNRFESIRIANWNALILRLTIIWYSITHSLFHSRLNNLPFLQILPTAALPFFFLNIHYVDSPDCLLLFLGISCFLLLVFFCFYTF